MPKIRIIFDSRMADAGLGPMEQVFVEVHDENGHSINAGEWIADGDYEALEIDLDELSKRLTP